MRKEMNAAFLTNDEHIRVLSNRSEVFLHILYIIHMQESSAFSVVYKQKLRVSRRNTEFSAVKYELHRSFFNGSSNGMLAPILRMLMPTISLFSVKHSYIVYNKSVVIHNF